MKRRNDTRANGVQSAGSRAQRKRAGRRALTGAVAVSLAMTAAAPALADTNAQNGGGPPSSFGIQASSLTLVNASPSSYLSSYQNALNYLAGRVQPDGQVLAGNGQPASTADTAYTAVALALSNQIATAQRIIGWLQKNQESSGGFSAVPGIAGSPDLRDTALALFAIGEVSHLGGGTTASWNALSVGLNNLLTLQNQNDGTFASPGATADAESNAIAIRALQIGSYLADRSGHANAAETWAHSADRAQAALTADNGVSRSTTTDMIAGALWGLSPQLSAQRQVGATNDLSFAYAGFGAKAGPGYYTGMDWIDGVSTFNYAIAAARAGLPDLAVAQYNYGLKLQNADGGFGSSAHPPVGPETGGFSAGPNGSSVLVTAHYLLATHALLTHGALGFGWQSATVAQNGATGQIMTNPPVLDPAIPMQNGPRVAVLIGSPAASVSASAPAKNNTTEASLQMNAAYELTQMGYRVTLFWYKPNQAEQFYNLNAFWNSLGSFQDVIASNGTFSFSNGFKSSFAAHQQQFLAWLNQGGRFIDAGDNGVLPLLGAQTASAPSAVNRVIFTAGMEGALAGNGAATAGVNWPNAATAYYSSAPGFTTFASGLSGMQQLPVAVGKTVGAGRVLLTTLSVANYAQDRAPVLAAMLDWANQGVQAQEQSPVNYATAAQQLYQAMQTVYQVSGTNLYKEHNFPAQGDRTYSYLWPFTQAFGGVAASDRVLPGVATDLSNMAAGLSQYYNAASVPPGYDSYVMSQGGGTQFFDDNGWTALDLMRSYADTGNQQYLQLAENLFPFLASGWSKTKVPTGGEYFNTNRIGRTQTATGSDMDAALRLYLATKNRLYLTFGQNAYTWDRTYMKGVNGLYNDGMSSTGVVGGTPFTYDTGVVLQADVLLYRITNDATYLARARQLAVEGMTLYTDPLSGIMVNNAGQSNAPFNEIFLRGLLMLYKATGSQPYLQYIEHQANVAYRYDRMANGIYGMNWSGVNDPTVPTDLLVQGGTLRLLGMLASLSADSGS